ncbi:MAG: HD domain-containing phosphohydrolase, partial [Myxococcota bacterium]
DVTERKQSEEAMRESESRFRAMVEQSISGFYLIQDGKFVYVNARFAEIFGYASPEEIVGKAPADLTAPKDRTTVAENIRRRLAGEIKSVSYSFTGARKDGTEVEVGVHGSYAVNQGRPVIMGLLQDISERKRAEDEIRRYVAQLEQAMQSTISVVSTIGELRDPYTHGHERRVGEIATAIAVEMELDPTQVEGIRIAGYLHDVGKIAVPAEILSKPGRLTKAEYDLVKDHAQQSYEILKTVPFPWPVAEAAWQHHERLDGSGYPHGLCEAELDLETRILAVCDVYDALISTRVYREAWTHERAAHLLREGAGRQFDGRCVEALTQVVERRRGVGLALAS